MSPDKPCALITGALGQDGWYLARRLLDAGHEVHGTDRHAERVARGAEDLPNLILHHADLAHETAMTQLVAEVRPTHIYNLAGSTSVARSWSHPAEAAVILGVGAVRLLTAAWEVHEAGRPVRFLQASSAEIFGDPGTSPRPRKRRLLRLLRTAPRRRSRTGWWRISAARSLRDHRHLVNDESPRRPETFVAAKIAHGVAEIHLGFRDRLVTQEHRCQS